MKSTTHVHVFDEGNAAAERGTRVVAWITAVMMVVEITAGWWFHSMALLADGWLAGGALVVVERATRSGPLDWPPGYLPGKSRRYGEATFWYGWHSSDVVAGQVPGAAPRPSRQAHEE